MAAQQRIAAHVAETQLLRLLRDDPDPDVRLHAAETLVRVQRYRRDTVARALAAALDREQDPAVKVALIDFLDAAAVYIPHPPPEPPVLSQIGRLPLGQLPQAGRRLSRVSFATIGSRLSSVTLGQAAAGIVALVALIEACSQLPYYAHGVLHLVLPMVVH
ncbi:MAG TPA: hypothetical protein VF120_14290 [Ktedonobacterales bacterium]